MPSVLGDAISITSSQLLQITNADRKAQGLSQLHLDDQLSKAATMKAADMFSKDYWAHNAPDGTTPWVFIKNSGYSYTFAGENLARGFFTAKDTVDAWMASPSHRENMLSTNYTDVGFAVEKGKLSGEDTILVVEMFGNKGQPSKAQDNQQASGQELPNASPELAPNIPQQLGISISQAALQTSPFIDSTSFSRAVGLVFLFLFIAVLAMDVVIVKRKQIVRLVGHNLDHMFFFCMLVVLAIMIGRGLTL